MGGKNFKTCKSRLVPHSIPTSITETSSYGNLRLAKPIHNLGLNFGIEALIALEGTLLFEEIVQAKEHLREQYDLLCPALCCSHPDVFQPELYTWECFLWACELWYSNSLKIILTDGKLKTCLVPIAGLFNHSLCPHITKYGRMDPATKSLKFSLSRQCREGEQCFLSYGNFSSSHLITFYGFLPKGNNLYDTIQLGTSLIYLHLSHV
ncbi:hypothetical protein GIB67_032593 [Kingdonia uniflora]|uniref:SET domain-containing protein n=1 Tax=Kingdonia uniflora TaxID=39325 RepID=A0A7J7LSE7_9MAGN|nr:hypothetical protein GIB67_032593 [Kingdonia uniflora]